MEPNPPAIVAKKLLNYVRIVLFMLRKGISKSRLMMELHLMTKRGKIAGKAIRNLMFHHHSNFNCRPQDPNLSFGAPNEYEFSCSNSPAFPSSSSFSSSSTSSSSSSSSSSYFPFHLRKRKTSQNQNHSHSHHYFSCMYPTVTDDDQTAVHEVEKVLEMLNAQDIKEASPVPAWLPGFGKSPRVRQLRITDSPFPLTNTDEDSHVDKAAEEFIQRFYNNLRLQNSMAEKNA